MNHTFERENIEYVLPEEIEKRSFEIIAAELAEPCEFGEDLDLVRLELCLALAV